MSDAWEEIQAVKSKRNELRERLQKRRKEREDLLGGTTDASTSNPIASITAEDDECATDSHCSSKANREIEANVLRILTDAALSLPVDSKIICRSVSTEIGYQISHTVVCNLLQKFAAQELIKLNEGTQDNKPVLTISHAEHVRLIAVVNEEHKLEPPQKRKQSESNNDELLNPSHTLTVKDETSKTKREKKAPRNDDVMVN